jgi:hypothetical protein
MEKEIKNVGNSSNFNERYKNKHEKIFYLLGILINHGK